MEMLASLACLVAESTLPSAVTSMVPLISCDLLAWLQESGSLVLLQIGGVLFHVGDFGLGLGALLPALTTPMTFLIGSAESTTT